MSTLFDLPFEEPGEEEPDPSTDGPGQRRIYTVAELTAQIRGVLESRFFEVWVEGELSNCRVWNTGHLYFTIKDAHAQLKGVMFRTSLRTLRFAPKDGLRVVARGRVTVYDPKGEYQIVCEHFEPEGLGARQLAFEQLKARLTAEGLFSAERKRPLPELPRKVGVVTSLDGAAVRDIIHVLRRRYANVHIVIRPTRVQGDGASLEIARAIRAICKVPKVDVVIVGRGGGSIEDLWAFNEEAVARAIAECPLPVISAVGHEVDVTIADLVADVRAPTPSAAAEAVVQDGAVLRDALRALPNRFSRALRGAVERRGRRIGEVGVRLERAMQGRIGPVQDRMSRAHERMERLVERRVERRRQALHALAGRLDALSPLAVLGRGYAVALGEGGHVLRRTADLPPGMPFTLRVADGSVGCRANGEESR